jgi:hypothetical protein
MEIVMTIVAWGMITSIAVGAIGGWSVLMIAVLDDLRASDRFAGMKRLATPRVWPSSFLKQH